MREVIFTTSFRKDHKRLLKSSRHDLPLLQEVVALLAHDLPLEARHRDHALSGNWAGYRECHIKPDWLLIYKLPPEELVLVRCGSHAQLFG